METIRKTPKIKICGITDFAETEYLNEAKVSYAGFVFYEKSRRNISPDMAAHLAGRLKKGILKVAVTVNPTAELVREIENLQFDILQVHGEFDPKIRENIRLPVWRAVNITDSLKLEEFFKREEEEGTARIMGYVADGAGYGSGTAFSWKQFGTEIWKYAKGKEKILAGGLTEQNVRKGILHFCPDVVDVSSGVEENGKKSREKIIKFVRKVREDE